MKADGVSSTTKENSSELLSLDGLAQWLSTFLMQFLMLWYPPTIKIIFITTNKIASNFATAMNHNVNMCFLMVLCYPGERVVQTPKGVTSHGLRTTVLKHIGMLPVRCALSLYCVLGRFKTEGFFSHVKHVHHINTFFQIKKFTH